MSTPIFIDTAYILALVNTADQYHQPAAAAAAAVAPPFVTTEAVLVEIGNALSRARWRHLGIDTLYDLRTDSDIGQYHIETPTPRKADRHHRTARLAKEVRTIPKAIYSAAIALEKGGRLWYTRPHNPTDRTPSV